MKYLLSKVMSLFKPKEKRVFSWAIRKDFFKNCHIHLEEWDASNIYAKKLIIK